MPTFGVVLVMVGTLRFAHPTAFPLLQPRRQSLLAFDGRGGHDKAAPRRGGFDSPNGLTESPVQDAAPASRTDESSLRYRGWRVVLACFLTAVFLFGLGLYSHGVYLAELQRLNGWPTALIAGASTLSFLLSNVLATFTSELVTRLGPKQLVLLGIAALAASTALLASATSPWLLYAAFILMALGWIGMGTVVMAAVVSPWFVRRRGLAISLAFTGASFGGVVVTPTLVFLVERFGFSAAMLITTAIMVAVLVPVAVAWIGPPSARGPLPNRIDNPPQAQGSSQAASQGSSQVQGSSAPAGISRAELIRSLAFWTISIPFALALLAQIGFIVHQIAALEPKIGRANAAFAVSVMTFMAIAGRLGLGMVVDRLNPRLVAGVSLASQAAALLVILQADTVQLILVACAVFGFSVGNIITLPPLIIHREFDAASFVVVMGLSSAISGTVGALGPALLGLVRGWSGDYHMALVLCIALELVAAALVVWRRLLAWWPASQEGRGVGLPPSLRAKRSNPSILAGTDGLLRRFAPRNDGRSSSALSSATSRHPAPAAAS